ncbi:MAG: hypothetical protein JSU74_02250 [Candidatus Zixiibacteriota bacterium]|nr:MAG: hypothetical protein JSU74_10905 [candidate division Zixibacteria bacterium]UCE24894.1 MAG: hypothetical protein JSU74_02250 [candidate division Zixibacteria bacterium]
MATTKSRFVSDKKVAVDYKFSDRDTATGNVRIDINIRSEQPLGNTRIHITPWYGVMVSGDTLWQENLTANNEFTLTRNLFVPPNDTSGVGITIENNRVWGSFALLNFFVTTADTLEIFDDPPWQIMYQYHPGELKRSKYGPFELLVARKPPTEQVSRITLQFAVWTNPDRLLDVWSEHGPWGKVHTTFVPGNGMIALGNTAWIERHPNSGLTLKEIELDLERGDTCQATFITRFRDSTASIDLFFVNTCDSISAWAGHPAADGQPIMYNPPEWKYRTTNPADWRDWLEDTVFIRRKQERLEARWQFNMEQMAKDGETLFSGNLQHREVEGRFWQRKGGEYEFTSVPWQPTGAVDSAAQNDPMLYPLVLDIRDRGEHEFIESFVPFLTSAGWHEVYYASMPMDAVALCLERRIRVMAAPQHYPELRTVVDLYRPLRNRLMPLTVTDEEKRVRSIHLTFDLSNADAYDFVSCICDDLESLDREGYYHGLVPWLNLIDLRQRQINIALYPNYPSGR